MKLVSTAVMFGWAFLLHVVFQLEAHGSQVDLDFGSSLAWRNRAWDPAVVVRQDTAEPL